MKVSKKKYPEYYFENDGGEGPLYIYFEDGDYGNAIDDGTGAGAGFFDDQGRMIAVLFDRVSDKNDHQTVKFKNGQFVEIRVSKGKVSIVNSTYSKKLRRSSGLSM